MRKQFKQVLRGTAELTIVFITIFVIPAIVGALVNLNTDVYFACVQHPGYCALMTIIGIIFCMVYMSMYQDEPPKKLSNEKA
jgi:tryptophan-rich sensory protein